MRGARLVGAVRRIGGLLLRGRGGDGRSGDGPTPRAEAPAESPASDAPDAGDGLPLEVERTIPGSLLLDIREPGEMAWGVVPGAMLLPMNLVPHHLRDLPRDRPITVYCAAGARSFGVAHWLREQGFPLAVSLDGGLSSLDAEGIRLEVPPGLAPGTWVRIPAGLSVDGAPLGPAERTGEVIEERDGVVRVVTKDEHGFLVRVEVPTGALIRR